MDNPSATAGLKRETMNVTLLEPQCRGLQHVPFNASLLETLLRSMPGAHVVFEAEPSHAAHVRQALQSSGLADRVAWKSTFGRITGDETIGQLPGILHTARQLARHCREEQVDLLLLCSSTSTLLAALAAARPRSTAIVAVLHACVAELLFNPFTQCLRNPLSMHTVARLPVPRGMRVVVLGTPILDNLKSMGLAKSRWASIDHPISRILDEPVVPPPTPVRFGYLAGFERNDAGAKQMLERVRKASGCEIIWIGRDSEASEALTPEEYAARLRDVHYTIWLGDPASYRLKASASFLDAIAMGKPLIYLKNDFINYYHSHRGPLGFPAADVDEVERTLTRLARTPLDDNYHRLVSAALSAARSFSPQTIAPTLLPILSEALEEASPFT